MNFWKMSDLFCVGCVLIILLGGCSLSLWISIDVIPNTWVPVYRTVHLGIVEDCQWFNGSVVPSMCTGYVDYPCFGVQASVQTSFQTIWPVHYKSFDTAEECQEVVQTMPFNEPCRINQCHQDFAGTPSPDCPDEETVPLIINDAYFSSLGSLMFLYCIGMIPYLFFLLFVLFLIVIVYEDCCSKRKQYQQINSA